MGARTPRAPVAQFALDAGTLRHVLAGTQIRSRRFELAHERAAHDTLGPVTMQQATVILFTLLVRLGGI